jgi:hypothetical protein
MHFLLVVLLLAFGLVAVYLLNRLGASEGPEALDGLRDILQTTRAQFASLKSNSGGGADLSTLIHSLYRSAINRRRALWYTRRTVISGKQWVILANPDDYFTIASDLDAIVGDLSAAFKQFSSAQRLVFNGTLEVVQVLSRESIAPGSPELMTYSRARSIELMNDATYAEYVQTETRLMTPEEVVAAAQGRRVDSMVDPFAPGGSRSPGRSAEPTGHDTASTEVRVQGSSYTAVAARLGSIELTDAPEPIHVEPIGVFPGLVLGRDRSHGVGCIPISKVSSWHAQIEEFEGWPAIVDCESTNGLYVNGERVERHTLRDGDEIGLGRYVTLRYSAPPSTTQPD